MSWMTARSKHKWRDRQGFIDDVRASLVGVAQRQDVPVTISQVEDWMGSVIGKYCDNVEWMSNRTWNTARNEIWRYLKGRPDVEVA